MVQTAILHAQFEIIHPFSDGNGRTGRILVPLFLYSKKILEYPSFYISEFLESNRDQYTDSLLAITEEGKWNEWIAFFLSAIDSQCTRNIRKAREMADLYESMKSRIHEAAQTRYAIRILDYLFQRPVFNTNQFQSGTEMSRTTAYRILHSLEESSLLKCIQLGSGRTPSKYMFVDLLKLL